MKIVFLDIDGVLNDRTMNPDTMSYTIDPDKAARLNLILKTTDASIVLSSAWRYLVHGGSMGVEGFANLLRSHGVMGQRLIGVTRLDATPCEGMPYDSSGDDRGLQISDWLSGCSHVPYVVIDDIDHGISERHPFVHTDGNVGLTDEDVVKAIALLEVNK